MRNHYTKSDKHVKEPFGTPGESLLYSMLQPEELVTFDVLHDRLCRYAQYRREEYVNTAVPINTDYLNLLVKKGYVKEIPGDSIKRFVKSF